MNAICVNGFLFGGGVSLENCHSQCIPTIGRVKKISVLKGTANIKMRKIDPSCERY